MNVRCAVTALTAVAVVAIVAIAGTFALAGAQKQLQNMKGSVAYQKPDATQQPIALNASVDLPDEDYTITGPASLAQLTLPDSSQVLMGENTKVQLASFTQTDVANAKFVIYEGKTRFVVRHPAGAHANYTFQTATGTVGVRGTEGDIQYGADGALHVNVYELCDKNYPVQVTAGGKVLTVIAGQSLTARIVNGVLQSQIDKLTQQMIDRFAPDFGVPANWDAATGEVVSYAQNKVAGSVPVVGGALASGLGGMFAKKSTPSPAPAKKSTSCG